MRHAVKLFAILALLPCGIERAQAGPISDYYLTAGDNGTNWIVQGSSAAAYGQNQPADLGEYAIAVGSTVRTLHNGNDGPAGLGSEYSLGGVFTGTNYTYPSLRVAPAFYDGARDATHNYSVDYNSGNVYQMDLDWSNAAVLFDTGFGSGNSLGITYDPTNNSLWVAQWGGDTVANFSLGGALLSSFSTGFGSISSLGMDYADNTLWMGTQGNKGTFYQYSRAGALLSTESYVDLEDQNTLGGEFAFQASTVPEPGSLVLACLGVAGLACGARRRRSAAKA